MGGLSVGEIVVKAEPVLDVVAELGESPLWDPATGLRWLDIPQRKLHTLNRTGEHRAVDLSTRVTAVERGPSGRLLAVTATGFGLLDPVSGEVHEFAHVVSAPVSMNDGAIDPQGRCWAGSAVRDGSARGALYRLDDSGATAQIEQVSMSNGIDWSPDGSVLYHVDSAEGTAKAWAYSPETGELGDARLLRRLPAEAGLPDGLTVDEQGGIWLAVWGAGQVWRLDPVSGETTAVVDVPTPCTTSCAFGGSELTTLYITTADHESPPGGGLLYAAEVPARGRLSPCFSGGA
ncbi:SMP-30/gluconolactonase/LRE family protein [Amycolatopsis acidicola]|uniref:SMP-30/gluconolactonase/LRE family protein n=1 Tax=Amycolatopsis acidicola TaxID=2596893 RepID=A0A5N0VIC1_9PSEU|nr:SMP-30/gluconolactonase/LRE family protein [Amycolatopsis acidicola]KAA9164910.1 SMP-30/gluconolactonase/LRE family protein [Amycolatopsis acidicola]